MRFVLIPVFFILICLAEAPARKNLRVKSETIYIPVIQSLQKATDRNSIYDSLHLNVLGLSRDAFTDGLSGLDLLMAAGYIQNGNILSIADLSLPSSKKRLFVIDVNACKLIFNTYVSHGRNSGKEMATQFSNEPDSYESSLGFYVTGDAYIGHHGYSLKLNGKEEGINDNAFARGIVMHSASYVNERMATGNGYIGRSEGCPAIPEKWHRKLIEKIKNGTCLFLYSADKFYATHSKMRTPWIG
jgi:L,D-transpeptidase catalytic domain